jgi:hypothetical protein
MYKVESNLELFHAIVGRLATERDEQTGENEPNIAYAMPVNYTKLKMARLEAMEALLWDENQSQWFDYNLDARKLTTHVRSPANFFPLWSGAHRPLSGDRRRAILNSVLVSGLIQDGGVLTTLVPTQQQWDSPNAWSPLQWLLVEGTIDRLFVCFVIFCLFGLIRFDFMFGLVVFLFVCLFCLFCLFLLFLFVFYLFGLFCLVCLI